MTAWSAMFRRFDAIFPRVDAAERKKHSSSFSVPGAASRRANGESPVHERRSNVPPFDSFAVSPRARYFSLDLREESVAQFRECGKCRV